MTIKAIQAFPVQYIVYYFPAVVESEHVVSKRRGYSALMRNTQVIDV